jgi:hypothetical protein
MASVAPRQVTAEVHCIAEVRLGVAHENLDHVARFYADMLGLKPWAAQQQIPGGLGLGDPQRGLYLQFRHDPRVEPTRRRFTLLVSDLEEVLKRLTEAGWPFLRCRGFGFTDTWLLVADPTGHLVELRPVPPGL